jgi:ArsR family transcriptional regulator
MSYTHLALTPTEVFKALADNNRAKMVLLIQQEDELCVCELTTAMNESQPKVSRHLGVLRSSGLLTDRRQGQWVYYRLNPDLPSWVGDVLAVIANANAEWLIEQHSRLQQMGDRPTRLSNCR